jgi:hypothetical protein
VSHLTQNLHGASDLDIFWDLSSRANEEEFVIISIFAWFIWAQRNRAWACGVVMMPSFLAQKAVDFFIELSQVARVPDPPMIPPPRRSAHWLFPRQNWVKINMDGAVFEDINKIGVGVVIRNDKGDFLAALSSLENWGSSPEDAEAIAATKAISFAASICLFDVILEGDSLNLMRALKDVNPNLSRIGHLIDYVKSESFLFRSVEFSFTPRAGNSVAHCLARYSKGLHSSLVWIEEPPDFICNALSADSVMASFT